MEKEKQNVGRQLTLNSVRCMDADASFESKLLRRLRNNEATKWSLLGSVELFSFFLTLSLSSSRFSQKVKYVNIELRSTMFRESHNPHSLNKRPKNPEKIKYTLRIKSYLANDTLAGRKWKKATPVKLINEWYERKRRAWITITVKR